VTPAQISTSSEYHHLLSIYVPIAIGGFVPVVVVALAVVVRYRRRRPHGDAHGHERNPFEGSYALLLACVVAFLLYLAFATDHKAGVVSERLHPTVVLKVTGSRVAPAGGSAAQADRVRRRRGPRSDRALDPSARSAAAPSH
jgi:heme/copper-type cytochrome/quinol oxidase subunit 2